MKPLVSVIIPIYNADKFLERCLESIIRQTYTNLEIILINDGSSDNSLNYCNTYSHKDPRIITINKKNEGVSIARNTGIHKSSGKFLTFLDADDWIAPNYIEQLMRPFENTNVDISICGYQICYEYFSPPSEVNHTYRIESAKEYLLTSRENGNFSVIVPWGKIFKKEIVTGISFPPKLHFEDEATVYKFFYKSNLIAECDYNAYYYFQSSNGLTKSIYPKHPEDAVQVFEEQYKFFKKKKDKAFYQQSLATLLWKCLTLYVEKKDKRKLAKTKIDLYLNDFKQYNINYKQAVPLIFFCNFPFIYLLYKKIF